MTSRDESQKGQKRQKGQNDQKKGKGKKRDDIGSTSASKAAEIVERVGKKADDWETMRKFETAALRAHRDAFRPPKEALLKMEDLRQVQKGVPIWVVEPQSYTSVYKMTKEDEGLSANGGKEKQKQIGFYHTGRSGIVHTGDGGDWGDEWWVRNSALLSFLLEWEAKYDRLVEEGKRNKKRNPVPQKEEGCVVC